MSNPDPRRGLPSASSMYRLANCPGSHALIISLRQVGRYYELPNRHAAAGTRIHKWLALERSPNAVVAFEQHDQTLKPEERAVAHKCDDLREDLIKQWANGANYETGAEFEWIIEKRFWYRQGVWPRFSGQPDFGVIDRKNRRAILINYKSGRIEAEPAADNLQLRTEVVLLKHARPDLEEIDAAIVEPMVTWESELVHYNGNTLTEAENQILAIVDRAQWERDKRFAGPWCTYCPARANCREALDYVQSVPRPDLMDSAFVELPRGEKGTALWEKIKVAKKLLATLEEVYTQILEAEPDALPGYILPAQGHERRLVPLPAKLKTALAEYLTGEEIDGCAEFYLGKIQELIGLKHHRNGKDLDQLFEHLTKEVVSVIHDRPFIRSLTKKERQAKELTNK
jgi:PD-(D/E)XK nuclease superfamily